MIKNDIIPSIKNKEGPRIMTAKEAANLSEKSITEHIVYNTLNQINTFISGRATQGAFSEIYKLSIHDISLQLVIQELEALGYNAVYNKGALIIKWNNT